MMDWEAFVPLDELDILTEPEEKEAKEYRETNAVVLYHIALDLGVIAFRAQDVDGIFVRFPVSGHFEIALLNSGRFKAWLTSKFFKARLQEPKGDDIVGALRLLESKAWEESKRKTFIRLAGVEGKIYLDMCDDDFRVIEVDSKGWRIVHNPDVWFMRSPSMRPLLEPKPGGDLLDLREFVNLGDEDFVLLVGWLVAACNPEGPFPILAISSEHGSGKSTTTSILKSVVDPDINPRLAAFKDADALFSTAASRWLMCYDNLSRLSEEDSNHLCRLATGGGFTKRMLYTDNDAFSCQAKRSLVLNGIHLTLGRMDLLDRAYLIHLLPIPRDGRKMEETFYSDFDRKHPYILGALLSALCRAIRERSYVPQRLPRMADGAAFVMRAEKGGGLPWDEGTFAEVLERRESEKRDDALMDDTTASKIVDLAGSGGWKGSLKMLLTNILESHSIEERKFLPSTSRGLSKKLEELSPLFRSKGIVWKKERTNSGFWVTLGTVPGAEDTGRADGRAERNLSTLYLHRANIDEHWESADSEDSVDKIPPSTCASSKVRIPGSESALFEDEKSPMVENHLHFLHDVHNPCDSKLSESADAVKIERSSAPVSARSKIPPVVSGGPYTFKNLPPEVAAEWLASQPEDILREIAAKAKKDYDPIMNRSEKSAFEDAMKSAYLKAHPVEEKTVERMSFPGEALGLKRTNPFLEEEEE
jgi:hypothetical protein